MTLHLLAIAGDMDRIDYIHEFAQRFPELPLGVMLRDARHRAGRVATLCMYATELGMPPNVVLIANGVVVRTAPMVHRTAKEIVAMDVSPIEAQSGPEPDSPQSRANNRASAVPFGASAHSLDEADRAARLGASYITLGPIFPTASKPGHPGIGLDTLASISAVISIPIFALGGMNTLDAMHAATTNGAHGIASISLFAPQAEHELIRVAEYLIGKGK